MESGCELLLMQTNLCIVVVGTGHGADLLAYLVVVGVERVDLSWICVWHLGREVCLTAQQVCQCIGTVVAGQEDIDDGLGQWFDVGDESWTAFIQHKDDGFAGFGQCLNQVTLIVGQPEVVKVARSFGVRVLTDASNDDVGLLGGTDGAVYLRLVFFVVLSLLVVGDTLLEDNVFLTIFITEGLVDGIVLFCQVLGLGPLPCVTPAAVQTAHLVGIGASEKDSL